MTGLQRISAFRAGATEHKLFVGGLAKSATSEQIAALFEKFGRVQDVYIMRGDSNEPKGPLLPPISASAEAAASWLDHAPRAVAMSARGGTGGPRFRCPGCAFVKFLSKDEALAAIAGLNEKFIMEVTRPLRAPHTRCTHARTGWFRTQPVANIVSRNVDGR